MDKSSSAINITSFIKDKDVEEYYLRVMSLLSKVKEEVSKHHTDVDHCEFILFGGFIRDIVQGVSCNILKKKDVDVYITKEHGMSYRKYSYLIDFLKSKVLPTFDSSHYESKVVFPNFNYSDTDSEELLSSDDDHELGTYAAVRFTVEGINFDFVSQIDEDDSFYNMFDFRCNTLCFSMDTGILKTRLDKSLLQECISDIKNKKLTRVTKNDVNDPSLFIYNAKTDKRRIKMRSYGYK